MVIDTVAVSIKCVSCYFCTGRRHLSSPHRDDSFAKNDFLLMLLRVNKRTKRSGFKIKTQVTWEGLKTSAML